MTTIQLGAVSGLPALQIDTTTRVATLAFDGPEARGVITLTPHQYGLDIAVNGQHLGCVDLFPASPAAPMSSTADSPQIVLAGVGDDDDPVGVVTWYADRVVVDIARPFVTAYAPESFQVTRVIAADPDEPVIHP